MGAREKVICLFTVYYFATFSCASCKLLTDLLQFRRKVVFQGLRRHPDFRTDKQRQESVFFRPRKSKMVGPFQLCRILRQKDKSGTDADFFCLCPAFSPYRCLSRAYIFPFPEPFPLRHSCNLPDPAENQPSDPLESEFYTFFFPVLCISIQKFAAHSLRRWFFSFPFRTVPLPSNSQREEDRTFLGNALGAAANAACFSASFFIQPRYRVSPKGMKVTHNSVTSWMQRPALPVFQLHFSHSPVIE